MSNVNLDPSIPADLVSPQEESSFADILSSFEQQQHADAAVGGQTFNGTIVSVRPDVILIDIGRKIEGSLSLAKWLETQEGEPKVGSNVVVTAGPRNEEGFYELSTRKVERPKDWTSLQTAFNEKQIIAGTVVEQVKGGFRVEIGVRAFLPASRSGVREADDMPKLVGQEIRCRITKLDTEKEDIVVDRRVVLEEEESQRRQQAFADLREGAVVRAKVRSVMDFGAFLDLGGVDGLLHVAEMSHTRITKASDVVKPGDELEVKILKVDPATRKISLSLKQLQEDPWSIAARTLNTGDRVTGTVSRLTDFGAFVELLPGVDGLIHLSELSWDRRIRKAGDLLKIGERVEVVILQVSPAERRIGLGYKQVLGDPWEAVPRQFPVGTLVEGTITNLTPFGAFMTVADGIEGMVHISDITNEKRIEHPKDKLGKGQTVKAVVLEVDGERRRLRLGLKQLEPTTVDHYIAEHHPGETVSGRLLDVQGFRARVELGEGVIAICELKQGGEAPAQSTQNKSAEMPALNAQSSDVSSLGAMLSARWKKGSGESTGGGKPAARAGEVRSFRIASLDPAKKLIELELAS